VSILLFDLLQLSFHLFVNFALCDLEANSVKCFPYPDFVIWFLLVESAQCVRVDINSLTIRRKNTNCLPREFPLLSSILFPLALTPPTEFPSLLSYCVVRCGFVPIAVTLLPNTLRRCWYARIVGRETWLDKHQPRVPKKSIVIRPSKKETNFGKEKNFKTNDNVFCRISGIWSSTWRGWWDWRRFDATKHVRP
jgi:hypothetical protein